jgi:hypothetical protein
LGIDKGQLSRWKNEDDWDGKLEKIRERVRDRMGLEKHKEDTELTRASMEEEIHLQRLAEIATMAMEAIESGEVKFERMSEVLAALQAFAHERRLIEGEPTERRETVVRLRVGGEDTSPMTAIRAMIEIVQAEDVIKKPEEEVIEAELVEPSIAERSGSDESGSDETE